MADFQALVARVGGLEFLGDEEIEFDPDEDFFVIDTRRGREGQGRTDRRLGGRLYLAMPDIQALQQLISLWDRWQRGEGLPRGFARWRDVFASLRDIRPWGAADRVSEETIAYWREEMENHPGEIHLIEVEMWFRESAKDRAAVFGRIAETVADAGGNVIHHGVVEEIGYDAILVDLPVAEIARIAEREEVHLSHLRRHHVSETAVFDRTPGAKCRDGTGNGNGRRETAVPAGHCGDAGRCSGPEPCSSGRTTGDGRP